MPIEISRDIWRTRQHKNNQVCAIEQLHSVKSVHEISHYNVFNLNDEKRKMMNIKKDLMMSEYFCTYSP